MACTSLSLVRLGLLLACYSERFVALRGSLRREVVVDGAADREVLHVPTAGNSSVVFGVLTCAKYLDTRLRAQELTWLQQVGDVIALSDAPTNSSIDGYRPAVEVVVDHRHPGPDEELPGNGAWRALSLVEALYERFPHAKWYFFVDDDTYIYVSNLMRDLGTRDPGGFHYIGWSYHVGPNIDGLFPGEYMPAVNIGGAGFAISHTLMVKLSPQIPRCREKYSWNWQGDMRIAKCIDDLGYDAEDDSHFYADNVSTSLMFGHGHLKGLPPVSFHHLNPDELYRLYASQMVFTSDGTSRVDFAEFAMRELAYFDAASNRSFTMRFGFEVNISTEPRVSETLHHARELVEFQAISTSPYSFDQRYRGECPAHAAKELEVHVLIGCGSCEGHASEPGDAAICHARVLHDCAFELDLALHCPPLEANVPTKRL